MYFTNSNDNVARTKNQLQKVSKDEVEPDVKFIRGNPENYLISKILDKKYINGKVFYLSKWKGFKDNEATWEPSKTFDRTKDLKEMRNKFNYQH
jgi:chromobox protein 3